MFVEKKRTSLVTTLSLAELYRFAMNFLVGEEEEEGRKVLRFFDAFFSSCCIENSETDSAVSLSTLTDIVAEATFISLNTLPPLVSHCQQSPRILFHAVLFHDS